MVKKTKSEILLEKMVKETEEYLVRELAVLGPVYNTDLRDNIIKALPSRIKQYINFTFAIRDMREPEFHFDKEKHYAAINRDYAKKRDYLRGVVKVLHNLSKKYPKQGFDYEQRIHNILTDLGQKIQEKLEDRLVI